MTPGDAPSPDPEALEAAARGWDNRLHAAALGVVVVAASFFPYVLEGLEALAGLRTVAALLAASALASVAVAAGRGAPASRLFAGAVLAGLAAVSAIGGDVVPLRLVPALVHLGVALVFFSTLRDEFSLVERGARMIQPVAPDFIGPYCRVVTAMWGGVLAIDAVFLAWMAASASTAAWRAAAGWQLWTWISAVSLAEFLVRKTYFRNYFYGGPFDRLWSRLFPAEATEMGRRSAEYIRVVRAKLAERDGGAP